MNGVDYEANRSTVHQSLISFTTCQPLDDWIKPSYMLKDKGRSLTHLRDHFSGEENPTRRITGTDRLKYALHYKNECFLPLETFLTKCKNYNIYETKGEVMTEYTKFGFYSRRSNILDLTVQ